MKIILIMIFLLSNGCTIGSQRSACKEELGVTESNTEACVDGLFSAYLLSNSYASEDNPESGIKGIVDYYLLRCINNYNKSMDCEKKSPYIPAIH